MPDPIADAAREAVAGAFDVLRRTVGAVPEEALDWEPGSPEHTNSIAVLTTHSLNATRMLLSVALGLPLPPRDREAEFTATSGGAERLLGLIDVIGSECLGILDGAPDHVNWGDTRTRTRPDGSTADRTAAFWLVHAVEHLRGHADEAALTTHMWDTDQDGPFSSSS